MFIELKLVGIFDDNPSFEDDLLLSLRFRSLNLKKALYSEC